jgi:hypothetical protein
LKWRLLCVLLKPLQQMQLQQQLWKQQEILLPSRGAVGSDHTLKPCSGA